MSRVIWKKSKVVSVALKDGYYVLAQMLESPYLAFFNIFSRERDWSGSKLSNSDVLFFCAVTRQFLKFSEFKTEHIPAATDLQPPLHWLKRHPGSRTITVWKGTPRERTFIDISARPGGIVVSKDITKKGRAAAAHPVREVEPREYAKVADLERTVVWTFPQLNERLHLCRVLGKRVDPMKEIHFNRKLPPEYATMVDILASRGTPEDWGYSSTPPK